MKNALILFVLFFSFTLHAKKKIELKSPDGQLKTVIDIDNDIYFDISHLQTEILSPSRIFFRLDSGVFLGKNPQILNIKKRNQKQTIKSPFYKRDEVEDNFNEVLINFKGNYSVIFRAYNEGIAYRYQTQFNHDLYVYDEGFELDMPLDNNMYASYVNTDAKSRGGQFFNSFEESYNYLPISKYNDDKLLILPLLIECNDGKKLCITESDLENFPGMFIFNDSNEPKLTSVHATYPKKEARVKDNNSQFNVIAREHYVAKTNGTRSYPWRIFVVSENDGQLADCDMVYRLASPSRIDDISWIKPGKAAWEWWTDWKLDGVDFKSGVNMETYKYFIDFASDFGLEYVLMDAGWAIDPEDLTKISPSIDMPELVRYADSKNVDLIIWAGYYPFSRDIERNITHFAKMGVKGFKIDFLDRDDQMMVDFIYKTADLCSKHNMIIDFHGVFKPTGLQRTYPNVVNYEGVNGLEQMKWKPKDHDQVTYEVIIPFIRMLAGPVDYTQGALRNATKENYNPVFTEPMSQGTRCRQLAQYVIYESPVSMLCDSPSDYIKEKECTEFISSIPTVWDETIVLDGKVAEYITIARRKDDQWFVGSMTNWNSRNIDIDFSFLPSGNYSLEIFKDGVNSDVVAKDYKKEIIKMPDSKKMNLKLYPGGGAVVKVTKLKD